jgi:hypothetical protein
MRGLTVRPFLIPVATLLLLPWAIRSNAQVTFAWNASSDPSVAGYYLMWGTSSGNYTSTISNSASSTSVQISNLIANQVYYFNIAAFNGSGTAGAYSGELVFTNTSSSSSTNQPGNGETQTNPPPSTPTLSIFMAVTNGPPLPSGSNMTTTTSGNGGSGTTTSSTSTAGTSTAANFWGVPPRLAIVLSNGEPTVNIGGTIGADLTIQSSTNIFSPDSWQTVTNISMTNAAPLPPGGQVSQPQDALDIAFVPAAEALPVSQIDSPAGSITYYRALMPYDYVILAGNVLTGKGYRPRMVLVNMPGIVCDDACYVTEGSSFIHYDRGSYALQLQGSGPTLRSIAAKLSSTLGLDWTSASEFTYSNGIAQIVATVVQTESASSDPVPGKTAARPSTTIDF